MRPLAVSVNLTHGRQELSVQGGLCYRLQWERETVWSFYGPWLRLMLQIGMPLLLLGTRAMFFFERGSTMRRLIGQFALWGWSLVLLCVALYFIIRILQNAFANLPGM